MPPAKGFRRRTFRTGGPGPKPRKRTTPKRPTTKWGGANWVVGGGGPSRIVKKPKR